MNIQSLLNDICDDITIAKTRFARAENKLEELKQQIKEEFNHNDEIFLECDEVAELLKMKPQTIRKKTMDKKIPFVKIDGKVLYNKDEILKWVMNQAYEDVRTVGL